jgi:hypothetical protein
MHGYDMRQPQQLCGCSAVNGHGKLVTVDCIDLVLSEKPDESPHASRIDWAIEMELFGRETTPAKQIPKPANPVRWSNGDDGMSALAQLFGQPIDHHFCPARFVGLEHHRNPKPRE